MARDYFIQTTSLVPPRGVRVEMTEIRPLRPNQAVILPGVAVLGQSLKFEVRILTVILSLCFSAMQQELLSFWGFSASGAFQFWELLSFWELFS